MPTGLNGSNTTYKTVLFGEGSLAWGESTEGITPAEVTRKAAAGDGQGQDILHSRRQFVLHPRGIKFVAGGIAGKSPTTAEFRAAAQWTRVYAERKQVRVAFLITN